jgi:hypothetical protein
MATDHLQVFIEANVIVIVLGHSTDRDDTGCTILTRRLVYKANRISRDLCVCANASPQRRSPSERHCVRHVIEICRIGIKLEKRVTETFNPELMVPASGTLEAMAVTMGRRKTTCMLYVALGSLRASQYPSHHHNHQYVGDVARGGGWLLSDFSAFGSLISRLLLSLLQ